ncbi:MAG TPA: 30S ribosomal protein S1, partial [Chitinophagaceae bacterium]
MTENNIINQNAEEQVNGTETTPTTTATTNEPGNEAAPVATGNEPVAEKPAEAAIQPPTAHDDFDWSIDKRNVSSYSREEREKYDKTY